MLTKCRDIADDEGDNDKSNVADLALLPPDVLLPDVAAAVQIMIRNCTIAARLTDANIK